MSIVRRRSRLSLVVAVAWLVCAHGAGAVTFTVDSTEDAADAHPGDGVCAAADGNCTLRAAVNETNALPGLDHVLVPAGTYTITIPDPGSDEDGGLIGDIDIRGDLDLVGAGADVTILDGNGHDRILSVGHFTVSIRGFTFQHGWAGVYAGGIESFDGNTTVTDCVFRENRADQAAAMIVYGGTGLLERVTVTGNHAQSGFGALRVNDGTLTLVDSTVDGNDAGPLGLGGGVGGFDQATIHIVRSTISGNVATRGGGVLVDDHSHATIESSTISGNRGKERGGGVYVGPSADATLANVTITENTADGDGGAGGLWIGATATVKNSIIAGNTAGGTSGQDCAGVIVAAGPILVEHADCTLTGSATGHILGMSANLAPLAPNGARMLTHALLPTSPAIDAGDPAGCTDADGNPLTADERGAGILPGGRCDLGAYEAIPQCPPADPDGDGDGVPDACDNCPLFPNPDQTGAAVCMVVPYDGLDASAEARFDDGLDDFAQIETPATGLGPVFNGRSCAECHNQPTIGGSSSRSVVRFGHAGAGGFDPLVAEGGSLLQSQGIDTPECSVAAETVPADANVVAHRDTPPLFGLGLVDLIPDRAIAHLARPTHPNRDGVSGRVSMVDGRVGRFGWKAQIATLADFAAEAYLNEMGITNPARPIEILPQGLPAPCDPAADPEDDGSGVAALADFMTLLAPLPVAPKNDLIVEGRRLFKKLRCQSCHTDKLRTDRSPIVALSRRRVPMFSDLLLHDMGPDLADGIVQGDASGSEFRTAPLWGVAQSAPYLHDGRAATLEDAILAHGGEGSVARNRFAGLSDDARRALVAFLASL